jgi:hypothetical protein
MSAFYSTTNLTTYFLNPPNAAHSSALNGIALACSSPAIASSYRNLFVSSYARSISSFFS